MQPSWIAAMAPGSKGSSSVSPDIERLNGELEGAARITVRDCLAWAAVVGYRQQRYTDDARQGGLEAAPGFQSRLEWLVHGKALHLNALGLSKVEQSRAAHAWLDTRILAPIVAGQLVTIQGTLLSAHLARSGLRVTMQYRISDEATREPLSETRTCTVFRGVDHGALDSIGTTPVRSPEIPPPAPGSAVEPLVLDRMFPHLYTECSDIWNPVHTERSAALAAGLDDIIVHGSALWAVVARRLTELHQPHDGKHCRRMFAAFRRPVFAGTALELQHHGSSERADYVITAAAQTVLQGFVEW